jgi:aryl-alcohol dehydrogenase-like predicted oxidoreductase
VATDASWDVPQDRLFAVTDVLEEISEESGHSVARLALAWLLTRPTVSSVVIGARNADQLRDNLAAPDVVLSSEHVARLNAASAVTPIYPYWHQRRTFLDRNPPPA